MSSFCFSISSRLNLCYSVCPEWASLSCYIDRNKYDSVFMCKLRPSLVPLCQLGWPSFFASIGLYIDFRFNRHLIISLFFAFVTLLKKEGSLTVRMFFFYLHRVASKTVIKHSLYILEGWVTEWVIPEWNGFWIQMLCHIHIWFTTIYYVLCTARNNEQSVYRTHFFVPGHLWLY